MLYRDRIFHFSLLSTKGINNRGPLLESYSLLQYYPPGSPGDFKGSGLGFMVASFAARALELLTGAV